MGPFTCARLQADPFGSRAQRTAQPSDAARWGVVGGFGGVGLLGVWMAKIVGNLWKMIGGHKAPHMFAVHYRVPKFGLIIERRCSHLPAYTL